MSAPISRLNEVSTIAALHKQQIKIVKDPALRVSSARRNEMMRQADYMEAQANRLAKMAAAMRRMVQCMAAE